ncbi:MAG TPA: M56 family metallopeptidase [Luteibacter sp.]|jgi:beta-lactamase regulating signal transducer with metallopeptidase domain|uniref:M56 family metallopeptidase n=1 Tax=Luteibacter sp. TaxID=1886636 RepID=UPI002F40EF7E
MLAWMIYAALVALALSAAALIAEQAARHRRISTRWPWIVAIAGSLVLPMAIATLSIPRPELFERMAPTVAAATAEPLNLRNMTSIPLASIVIDWSGTGSYMSSARIDLILKDIWFASSLTLLLFLGISTAVLHRRKRSWVAGTLRGMPVLVSESVGPAVVGLIRSRIVVPAWVMNESPEQQRYVMAHEQSHLKARDPLLVAVAMALLVSMPWNPILWWQFHRLRCAIEVDCDARVLGDGGDLGDYCETLIQVGQNQSEFIGSVTAMSESKSFLEQRIKIMLSKPQKWARASAFAMISIAFGMAVFAAQVTPPAAADKSASGAVSISPERLDAYAGYYALSDYSLLTIERKGNGLTATPIGQFLAQGTIDVSATSENEFLVPTIDVTLQFNKGAGNQITSVTVREHGVVAIEAPRVDRATAEQIRDALAARVKEQKPFPDSEKALQRLLGNSETGEGMTPLVGQNLARQHDAIEKNFALLGSVQSYKFEGVADYGWDIYDVQFEHGALQVFIQLDKRGLLSNSVMRRQ